MKRSELAQKPTNGRVSGEALIEAVLLRSRRLLDETPSIEALRVGRKTAYRFAAIEEEIVFRKVAKLLGQTVSDQRTSRDNIICCLRSLLTEKCPFRVYRLDLKSFYESLDLNSLRVSLQSSSVVQGLSMLLLDRLLKSLIDLNFNGLPRGIAISASLAEYSMQQFDTFVRSASCVFYFSRYVDDIIIMTTARENEKSFLAELSTVLPKGAVFNQAKQTILTFSDQNGATVAPQSIMRSEISFLGYLFTVISKFKQNGKLDGRTLTIDIAERNISKLKTRMIRSAIAYSRNKDFELLENRIRFLASNFYVHDKYSGERRMSGIYFNYPQLSGDNSSLSALDSFWKHVLFSKRYRSIRGLGALLTYRQMSRLAKISFTLGHEKKLFLMLRPAELRDVKECWVHE